MLSIVDPELMLSVPPRMTAYTGMDALCHAVECYLATVNQPASDSHALEAISMISRYLPVAVKDGGDLDARTRLAWASTEAGICESLSCCISHHSMEHAVSAYYPEVPHGAGLTMLPSVAAEAAVHHPSILVDYLSQAEALSDDTGAFSEYDWNLQLLMARNCGNPVFALILNDFKSIFKTMAIQYFTNKTARLASRNYYRQLSNTLESSGHKKVARIVKKAMAESIVIWTKVRKKKNG